MCGCLSSPTSWGPGLQPRYVSWLGLKLATLFFFASKSSRHSIHWATQARAEWLILEREKRRVGEIEWEKERERERLICCSTYFCIHWLILVCVLTGDRTHNLGKSVWLSNQLSTRPGPWVYVYDVTCKDVFLKAIEGLDWTIVLYFVM